SGKVAAISPGADVAASEGTTVLDLRGHSVMPGIVGMHEHLFYLTFPNTQPDGSFDSPTMFRQMSFSAPRLYLAAGATTARPAGGIEPYTDVRLKRRIESGAVPGPHPHAAGPSLRRARQHPLIF